jgi:hypothetical protein
VSETKTKAAPPAPSGSVQAGPGPKSILELKVSGHLMSLDAGLFCIFTPPGSPVPDQNTGLPGIRISLPPGPAFHPEAVNISTFREDGWMGGWNGAALVRVARGPAQILVTIYQAPNAAGDAPRLQIMKLADGNAAVGQARGAAAASQTAPAAAPAAVSVPQDTPAGAKAAVTAAVEITAHVQVRGDIAANIGEWIGTEGSRNWMEGFAITPRNVIGAGDIEYQAVLGRGWLSPWAEGGQFCGSRGMSLPILGLRVRLRGDAADTHECVLTASFVDGTKIGPLDNGEPAQAESLAPLEAFKVELRARGTGAPAAKTAPAEPPKAAAKPAVKAPPPKLPAKPAPKRK